jgi:hypothetical protein
MDIFMLYHKIEWALIKFNMECPLKIRKNKKNIYILILIFILGRILLKYDIGLNNILLVEKP